MALGLLRMSSVTRGLFICTTDLGFFVEDRSGMKWSLVNMLEK
jgi:hypothetical protein